MCCCCSHLFDNGYITKILQTTQSLFSKIITIIIRKCDKWLAMQFLSIGNHYKLLVMLANLGTSLGRLSGHDHPREDSKPAGGIISHWAWERLRDPPAGAGKRCRGEGHLEYPV